MRPTTLVLCLALLATGCRSSKKSAPPPAEPAPSAPAPTSSASTSYGIASGASAAPWSAAPTAPPPSAWPTESLPTGQPAAPPAPERYENVYRRFEISAGAAAYAAFNTTFQVSSPILVGAILDLEDFLGVDGNSFVGRFDTHYAFNDRHRVDLAYYDIRRSGKRTLTEDIPIGEEVIPAGDVETRFDTKILKLAYRYNFVRDDRTAIGASFGFHTMQLSTGFQATGIDTSEEFDATAPLPLIGLHWTYGLSRKWRLTTSIEALRVQIQDFGGYISDMKVGIDHDTTNHFGWGVALNNFQLDASFSDSGLTASVDYGYAGILLYLRAYY
jgi:hypothetical protein